MARKTKEDAERTYVALLDAAEQLFFDKGVARTTLADIAAAAGMTRGAIYWHFKDKSAVLQALFEQAMLPMEAMLAELDICSEVDPLGALRQINIQSLVTLAQSPKQQRVFSIMFHKCENLGEVMGVMVAGMTADHVLERHVVLRARHAPAHGNPGSKNPLVCKYDAGPWTFDFDCIAIRNAMSSTRFARCGSALLTHRPHCPC